MFYFGMIFGLMYNMKNKRREFLKNVCPSVALAFFGVTMLEACSSGADDNEIPSGGGSGGGNSNDKGYSVSGNTVVITLNNSNFTSIGSNGWMNFSAEGMLILKIDASTYRAFTNSCPHQGARDKWSYNTSSDKFVCSQHGNSYPTDCTTSGSAGGALKCFTTSLKDGKLTVVKS
ncbi:Rieske 2Fe-2S domain-containing protein [Flavobacteriaceae bacterium]|jgi:nitrite reductase/ring-hydroxylating ferredoxin subunit|nr:Rieske 2Fe-2S domain-containing protein [Flavobacteriaceae bacterium]